MPTGAASSEASVILLSGFLGAGKTTLLKHILSWQADLSGTVVIVNEFGEVGIDGVLLRDAGTEVLELTSGCICCTMSADLRASLMQVWERFRPHRILIESTGVADPAGVAEVLSCEALADKMHLEKIVTVLDAEFWEARDAFGPLFHHQLQMAHLILLNKVDQIDQDKIGRYLEQMHALIPGRQIVPTVHCRIDPETLWRPETRAAGPLLRPIAFFRPAGGDLQSGHASVDASRYVTFAFRCDRLLEEDRFRAFVAGLPFEVFRMKGPVRFKDRTVMINHVGGRTEWLAWDPVGETQLAFIGWRIDGGGILAELSRCIIDEPPIP